MSIQTKGAMGRAGDTATQWQPDLQWVPMPDMPPEGEQKVYCIVGVSRQYPYYALRATSSGQYRVDWGDGTVTNHASNTIAYHTYDMDHITSGVTDTGFQTALVTVMPVVVGGLRTLLFYDAHPDDSRPIKTSMLYYVRGRTLGMTSVRFNASSTSNAWYNDHLECVDLLDTAGITSCYYMFANCAALRYVPQLDTGNATLFDRMFYACAS